jgi:hypothetical protein
MVQIFCAETSVTNYHYSLFIMPEDRSSQLCSGFVFLIGGCRIRSGFDEFMSTFYVMSVKCG